MAKENFFPLNRDVQSHWTWDDKPFSKGQAWVDLLLLANYKDKKISYKGEVITCKRGDVNLSIASLANRWGWSICKARRFLRELESDESVIVNATKHRTVVTIVNYAKFQDAPIISENKNKKNTKNANQNEFKNDTTKPVEKYTSTQHSQSTKSRPKVDQKSTSSRPVDITKKEKKEKNIYRNVPAELEMCFSEYACMRDRIKKPIVTEKTVTRILNKLNSLAPTYEEQKAILNASTDHCWLDVYPLNEKTEPKKKDDDFIW